MSPIPPSGAGFLTEDAEFTQKQWEKLTLKQQPQSELTNFERRMSDILYAFKTDRMNYTDAVIAIEKAVITNMDFGLLRNYGDYT
jgi:hypothetical protein